MAERLQDTIALLDTLIGFDTTSHKSNLDCIAYIEDYLKKLGAHTHRLANAENTKASLFATLGDAKGGVVLSGHTDVVPVEGQAWEQDAFTLTDKGDGKLYGRGTCDMKGFIACALAMAPHFKQTGKTVHFAFSYDEEVGCLSAPELADHLKETGANPSLVVVGEPTSMDVVDSHKSIHSFITRIRGQEGHSSDPAAGVNAVAVGAELVLELQRLAKAQQAEDRLNTRFLPPYSTIHVGVLKGGTARNIIPNACEMAWEIRGLPEADVDGIVAEFNSICAQKTSEMQVTAAHTGIETQALSRVPGLLAEPDNPAVAQCLHACGHNHTRAVSFATEAGIFQTRGFPTLICGPGSIAQAHKANEFVEKSQLASCLDFLQKIVD